MDHETPITRRVTITEINQNLGWSRKDAIHALLALEVEDDSLEALTAATKRIFEADALYQDGELGEIDPEGEGADIDTLMAPIIP